MKSGDFYLENIILPINCGLCTLGRETFMLCLVFPSAFKLCHEE